jgi:hypothetical protein
LKIRLLPDTELANYASLEPWAKRAQLRNFDIGIPPYSLHPFRCERPDIVNAQFALLPPADPTPWREIERRIRNIADPGAEAETCVSLAKSYHEFALKNAVMARFHGHPALKLGGGRGFDSCFWEPYVLIFDGRMFVVFIDARRSGGLTSAGLRFAYSMMHEGLRAIDPDLAAAELLILKFGTRKHDRSRPLRLLQPGALELYSLDLLDAMIGETYRIWEEVLRDRRGGPPPGGTGTDDIFGGPR